MKGQGMKAEGKAAHGAGYTPGEHYTSIAPDEEGHIAAMCGCTLHRSPDDGVVRFYQCATHDAAPRMLEIVKLAWNAAHHRLEGDTIPRESWQHLHDAARAILRDVQGEG